MRPLVAFELLALGFGVLETASCTTTPAAPGRCPALSAPPSAPAATVSPPAPTLSAAPKLQQASAVRGKVAVAIVVDQLAGWVTNERLPHLPNGGFARLRREGTWVKDSVYLHATTETAPGHASLFTGRTPREHRIVGNAVWRSDLKRVGSLLDDEKFQPMGPNGVETGLGASLSNLRGQTLADALRERDPEAVVVALSLKDRGVAFAAGRNPTAAVWYNEAAGTLTSSTAFTEQGKLPAFSQARAKVLAPSARLTWSVFDPLFVEAHQQTPDDQVGESQIAGGRKFPHTIGGPTLFAGYRLTPEADALLADLAIASLTLRQPEHPMLLSISFSTNDYVGHTYGPNSWEAWSELASLDATLARLFNALDSALGADGYSVVLSADHGIVPAPEVVKLKVPEWCGGKPDFYERPCLVGLRVKTADLEKALNDALQKVLGLKEPPVFHIVDSRLILSDTAHALNSAAQKQLDQLLRVLLKRDPSVADVFALSEFKESCPPNSDESVRALVCRGNTETGASGFYDIPGDYYIVLKPGHFWGSTDGVNHGAPYRYDRSVPLLVRYPGAPGERVVEHGLFGSFYDSLWYALTGEVTSGPYGGVVGAR